MESASTINAIVPLHTSHAVDHESERPLAVQETVEQGGETSSLFVVARPVVTDGRAFLETKVFGVYCILHVRCAQRFLATTFDFLCHIIGYK